MRPRRSPQLGARGSIVLGLSGGTTATRPATGLLAEGRLDNRFDMHHDAAAALVRDGSVIGAIEEERLNRLKHTNRIAARAAHACLAMADLTIGDVDRIAYYVREDVMDRMVVDHMLRHPRVATQWTGRSYLAQVLSEELGHSIDPACVACVEHHLAHAASAYLIGPFPEALVVTLDGIGDGLAGTVWAGRGGELTRLLDIPGGDSLGNFYLEVTRYLAYDLFDEYKVMGLAAYGDPSRYRHLFQTIVTLEAEGRFTVHASERARVLEMLPPPRRLGEPLTRVHQDVAAAAQETIERAVLHMLTHYRRESGLRYLCAAGGVLHNSTMVGKIARCGLFDGVFVQPAASDAGCAIGAALVVQRELTRCLDVVPLTDVYWGPDLGGAENVRTALDLWADLVSVRRSSDLAHEVAGLLAAGAIVGFVQGRSEFGPRALGNRSILADPRPAENKTRINAIVKHRESFRPFAPAVLTEDADMFFEMPPGTCGDFMTLTVPVRSHARAVLAAVTHVDGTARVQTVSRVSNPRLAALIEAFAAQTGVPVLLNTSFNHSVEPIVQSVDDSVTCFLTTGLDALVVDDFIVTKREDATAYVLRLVPAIPDFVRVVHAWQPAEHGGFEDVFRCEHVVTPALTRTVSAATCRILQRCDGRRRLEELVDAEPVHDDRVIAMAEIRELWVNRLVRLLPVASEVDVGESGQRRVEGAPASTAS